MLVAPTQLWESKKSPRIARCPQGLGTKLLPGENHCLRSLCPNGDDILTLPQGRSLSVLLEWLGKHTGVGGVGGCGFSPWQQAFTKQWTVLWVKALVPDGQEFQCWFSVLSQRTNTNHLSKLWNDGDSPGGPVAKIPSSQCRGQGTRSYLLQLRVCVPQLRILHATMKIEDPECWNKHPNKHIYFLKNMKWWSGSNQLCTLPQHGTSKRSIHQRACGRMPTCNTWDLNLESYMWKIWSLRQWNGIPFQKDRHLECCKVLLLLE